MTAEGEHGVDEARHALGDEQRVERMRRAEGVPEREGRVVSARRRRDAVVRRAVASVHVRLVVRLDAEVIEGRVPARLLFIGSLHELHPGEKFIPRRAVRRAHGLEGLPRRLDLAVPPRALLRHARERDLHDERPVAAKLHDEPVARAVEGVGRQAADRRPRAVELHRVEEPVERPPPRPLAAGDLRPVGGERVVRLGDAQPELHVERLHQHRRSVHEELRPRARREREAPPRDARRSRRLRADAAPVERDGVMVGCAELRLLAERRGEARLVEVADERHEREVAHRRAPRAVEVRL